MRKVTELTSCLSFVRVLLFISISNSMKYLAANLHIILIIAQLPSLLRICAFMIVYVGFMFTLAEPPRREAKLELIG